MLKKSLEFLAIFIAVQVMVMAITGPPGIYILRRILVMTLIATNASP